MFKKRLCFRFDKNCNPAQHMQSLKAAQSSIYRLIFFLHVVYSILNHGAQYFPTELECIRKREKHTPRVEGPFLPLGFLSTAGAAASVRGLCCVAWLGLVS